MMKQKIYILGVLNALIVFLGAIFKVNHFPGAGVLLTIGLLAIVLLFLPLALSNHYKAEGSRQNLLLYIVTYITCSVIFISMLFKIMHWPLAGILLTIALPFPYVVFLPVFLSVTSKNKNFNIYNTVFVLLLLALNSVFSGLLALNVTRERIEDSYNLSINYNKMETVLSQLPDKNSEVNIKIDEVLRIVDEYQELILKEEGLTLEQWKDNPLTLRRPDASRIASIALINSSDGSDNGSKLLNSIKGLIGEINKTPGYENLTKNAPLIFDFTETVESDEDWTTRIFHNSNLSWTLIYLDGLRTNLLSIRASSPATN